MNNKMEKLMETLRYNETEYKPFSHYIKCIRILGNNITDTELIERIGEILNTQMLIDIDREKLSKMNDSEGTYGNITKEGDLIKRLRKIERV